MDHGKNDQGVDSIYVYGIAEKQDEIVIGEIAISMTGVVI